MPRHLRREMSERTFLMGRENIAPSRAELDRHIAALKAAGVAAVAVVFLHSYQNPAHEKDVVGMAARGAARGFHLRLP